MIRLLADENFDGNIVRGLLLRKPDADLIRVQDSELSGAADPEVLAWAAVDNRILLTHDRSTVPDFAYERLAAGDKMPGVFLISDRWSIGGAIDELLLILECTDAAEWDGKVVWLPL